MKQNQEQLFTKIAVNSFEFMITGSSSQIIVASLKGNVWQILKQIQHAHGDLSLFFCSHLDTLFEVVHRNVSHVCFGLPQQPGKSTHLGIDTCVVDGTVDVSNRLLPMLQSSPRNTVMQRCTIKKKKFKKISAIESQTSSRQRLLRQSEFGCLMLKNNVALTTVVYH